MGRTRFPFTPQLGKLGEKRLQALSFRTLTQIARVERNQGGLAFADLMQNLQWIQFGELRSESFFGRGGCDRAGARDYEAFLGFFSLDPS